MEQKEKQEAASASEKTAGTSAEKNVGNTNNRKKQGASPREKRAEEAALHANHRQRVRNRFFEHGLEGMEDHQVLEMLLFYSIPRCDTNGLAHRLLNTFGSFAGVFDAPIDLLMQVPGIGKETAILIKFLPSIWNRYRMSEASEIRTITSKTEMEQVMCPMFIDKQQEQFCCVYLDGSGRILKKSVFGSGSIHYIAANVPEILRGVIMSHAECVAVAHSHPGGYAAPSHEDITGTILLAEQLQLLNVKILDHMIVAPNDVFFLSSSNRIPPDLLLFSDADK